MNSGRELGSSNDRDLIWVTGNPSVILTVDFRINTEDFLVKKNLIRPAARCFNDVITTHISPTSSSSWHQKASDGLSGRSCCTSGPHEWHVEQWSCAHLAFQPVSTWEHLDRH
ncbi:Transposable element tcb2 transposase [Caligus rogercresseyi]|uniref:Transposable element tcb2 transposase n=1 Tax=Caligus rogercresseyi TaxID=217165 RepID=A0A7T8JZ27_CALRO|nr:Transposable element tcb2 transposase [Caligus rogercresseyi]